MTLDPGATTFTELTDEIVGNLLGYVRDHEIATHLTSALNSTDVQMNLYDTSRTPGTGVIEIDDELLWAQEVDRSNNTLQVAPYGRGYQGSTAAAHSQNARVTFAPRFPRFRVKRAINQTIASIGDQVPAVGTTTFEYDAMVTTYSMPATAEQGLEVVWQSIGPSERWIPVQRYQVNQNANTTAWPTGRSIDIADRITPGQTVQVTYIKNPTLLSAGSDVFTATGFPASLYDVVVWGTMARLVAPVESGRLDFKSVEADQLDNPTQFGSAQNLSKYFNQLFLMRLQEERQKFYERYQPRIRRAI